MKARKLFMLAVACLMVCTVCGKGKAKHLFYIGLDGWGSYSYEKADMPTVKRLANAGSFTLKKRTVLPSSSAPNWAAMFMGVGPEIHGFYECCSRKPDHQPSMTPKNDIFPTIFQILRDQKPDAEIGCIYEWSGIEVLIDTLSMSYYKQLPPEQIAAAAVKYVKEKKPTLAAFVYDDPDHVGHHFGHDTEGYYKRLPELDAYIAEIVKGIEEAGILDESVIIITSDHGGINKGHGGRSMMEMETPFIISGKNVKQGVNFDDFNVIQYDVAATMAYVLGLKQPEIWYGRAVKQIFK